MRKIHLQIKSTFIFFLILLLLTGVSGCNQNDSTDTDDGSYDGINRTVILYIAAQNSLGASTNFMADSTEIMKGCQYINNKDRLLVFVDNKNTPKLYQIQKDSQKPTLIREWSHDVCSTSPQVLQDVLSWCRNYYPSKEYGLVMWSHADGWLPSTNTDYSTSRQILSFGIDVGPEGSMHNDRTHDFRHGAQMNIDDMATAIFQSGIHLKYIFFDACLMQNIEVGYALRNVTDYIIASPIAIAANGANYTHQLQYGLFSNNLADIITTYLADVTDPLQSWDYDDYGIVFSLIDTQYMEELANVTAEILPHTSLVQRNNVNMDSVLNYQAYSSQFYYRPHNYDALEAMRNIVPNEDFKKFEKVLNKIVIQKVATPKFWIGPSYFAFKELNLERYSGISLFIPQQIYTDNANSTPHGDLNLSFQKTEWYHAANWQITGW